MRVEIDDQVVDGSQDPLCVLAILAMGAEGRHRVLASRTASRGWLSTLPDDLRDEAELALDLGEEDEVLGVDLVSVGVVPPAQADELALRLDPRSALSLLARPLTVVLENGANDGAFLMAFAPPALRQRLESAKEAGWLVLWNGGGIDGCKTWAQQLAHLGPVAARVFVLADSDATEPGSPSPKAGAVSQALQREETRRGWEVGCCGRILERRTAENYVVGYMFAEWWATEKDVDTTEAGEILARRDPTEVPNGRQDKTRIWLAAATLDDCPIQVKHHLDVDQGRLRGPGPTKRTADTVWSLLDPWQQAVLQEGLIKRNVGDFFRQARGLTPVPADVFEVLTAIRRAL